MDGQGSLDANANYRNAVVCSQLDESSMVIKRPTGSTGDESSAVNPDEDGKLL
jgi:hypothetical protein